MQQFSGQSSGEGVSYYNDSWSFILIFLDSFSRWQWMDDPACFYCTVSFIGFWRSWGYHRFIVMRCSWSIYRCIQISSCHYVRPLSYSFLVDRVSTRNFLHTVSICLTNASSTSLTTGRVHIVKNSCISLMSNSSLMHLWGVRRTKHDAHTLRGSTYFSHTLCDGKAGVMIKEDALGED